MTDLSAQVGAHGIGWEDGFLPGPICQAMLQELDFTLWKDSEVVRHDDEHGIVSFRSDERRSRSAAQQWFGEDLLRLVEDFERRLCAVFRLEADHLEPWQAIRYGPGGRFGTHHDGGVFAGEPAGERVLTFLLYLDGPESGGETYFPALDLLVEPCAGKLVVWNNLQTDGTPDPRFVHAATPVHAGRKTVLTSWSRQHRVRSP